MTFLSFLFFKKKQQYYAVSKHCCKNRCMERFEMLRYYMSVSHAGDQDRLLDILSQLVSCNRFLIIRFSVLPLFDRVITCLSFFSLLTDFFFALFMPSNVFSNCPLLITHLDCVLLSWSLLGNSLEFFIFIYLPVNCSSFADLIKVDSLIIQQLITFRGT